MNRSAHTLQIASLLLFDAKNSLPDELFLYRNAMVSGIPIASTNINGNNFLNIFLLLMSKVTIDNAIAMYAPLDSVQSIPKSEKAKQTLLNFLCFECFKYTDENAQNGVVIIKNVAKISGLSNVAAALDGYWLLIISNGNRLNTQSFN